MFTNFFYFLRSYGLKVSLNEWMTLLEAMELGLHDSSLTGFYHLARMTLVKSESDFDRFDQAFLEYFKTIKSFEDIPSELLDWLAEAARMREYDKDAVDQIFSGLTLERLRKMMEERLKEQKERHDHGSHWVGTGGISPFGHSGYNPTGIRVGGTSKNHNALQVAAERNYQDFRRDTTLDLRQFQMAFRRLRQLSTHSEGPKDELQLDKTIQSTCENAGHLKLEFDRPRSNEVRLLLLFDSGGSMWPYAQLCSRLFQAAHQSSHFKELRTYYFHNCIYDLLHTTPNCRYQESIPTEHVLSRLSPEWKVIIVGDGAMAPSELLEVGGCADYHYYNEKAGIYWIRRFTKKCSHLVWLNPISKQYWPYTSGAWTIHALQHELPMYPLTLDGLDASLKHLMAAR